MRKASSSRGAAAAVAALVCMLVMPAQEASAQAPAGRPGPWTRSPSIIVLSPEINELHLAKTRTAVAFWNRELAALGIGLRLGAITHAKGQMSNSDYTPRPDSIVIVFGGGSALSHGHSLRNNQGGVIHMRIGDGTILIHELGHALGLPHNFDQPSVMSRAPDGLHLGATDKARLLAMYSAQPARRQTAAR